MYFDAELESSLSKQIVYYRCKTYWFRNFALVTNGQTGGHNGGLRYSKFVFIKLKKCICSSPLPEFNPLTR